MTQGDVLSVQGHLEVADRHLKSVEQIAQVSETWAIIACFYSSYHYMRAALESDPIFEDATALSRISTQLQIGCKAVTHHNAHIRSGRLPGVNDVAKMLYGKVGGKYVLLHGASVTCRYAQGAEALLMPSGGTSRLELYLGIAKEIQCLALNGELKAARPALHN